MRLAIVACGVALGCTNPPTSPHPSSSQRLVETPAQATPRSAQGAAAASPSPRTAAPSAAAESPPLQPPSALLASRPYRVYVPRAVDAAQRPPLFVFLHGLGASADVLWRTLDLSSFAEAERVVVAAPDGTHNAQGARFWNATDACCDFDRVGPNDVRYLEALIDDVLTKHSVDAKRVFVIGYSNGAFMAHRAACELSHRVAGVAGISGVGWSEPSRCRPTEPVTILQIHGDADRSVTYRGGRLRQRADLPSYPGAQQTVAHWAKHNRCALAASATSAGPSISDKQTTRLRYGHCPATAVELWTVHDGGHLIGMHRSDLRAVKRFLMAHPKPEGDTAHEPLAHRQ